MLSRLRKGVTVGGATLLTLGALSAQSVVINEVYYDAPGVDNGQVFVELFGPPGTDIGGWSIQGIEGTVGGGGGCNPEFFRFPIGTKIGASGFVVVADADGTGNTSVANANFIVPDMDLENGADAVQLIDRDLFRADAVAYGPVDMTNLLSTCNGLRWFEGNPARDVLAPLSIERCPAGSDTGDNDTDFTPNVPTPGAGEACCSAIEWVNQGVGNSLTIGNGDSVGLDVWLPCSGGGVYLILGSFVDPAVTPPPPPFPVFGPLTGTIAGFANTPPFVAWGGPAPANGRILGTAALDWSAYAGVPPLPMPVTIYVGAVGLSGPGFSSTNSVDVTWN